MNPGETHPYNNIATIPEETEIIIMGTCPPPENEANIFKWYYGSPRNHLWKQILIHAHGFAPQRTISLDYAQQFLKDKKAWMFDICKRYSRAVSGSALDCNILDIEKEKLSALFKECRYLKRVILTGTKTETLFRQALECEKLIQKYTFSEGMTGKKLPRTRRILLSSPYDRQLTISTVASPSPRNGSASYSMQHFRKALPDWFASSP